MKRIVVVAVAVALLMGATASAQMGGGRHHRNGGGDKTEQKPRVDEEAYKAALKKIPEPKGNQDPWGNTRSVDPANKKNKK